MRKLYVILFFISFSYLTFGQCNQVYTWSNFKAISPFFTNGTILIDGKLVNFSIETNYTAGTFPSVTWTEKAGQLGETKICFSEYVTDPAISFLSLGSGSIKVVLNVDIPYETFIVGNNINYVDTKTIIGVGGNGTVIFPGVHKCITITSTTPEKYTAINVGLPIPKFPISIMGGVVGCDRVTLTASGGKSYLWNGGIDSNKATNTFVSSGLYFITAFDENGCQVKKSVFVIVLPPTPTISTIQKTICYGESYLGYKQTGIYYDTLKTNLGCDSIRILNLSVINLKVEKFDNYNKICSGKSLTLKPIITPNNYPLKYQWSTGDTSLSISVSRSGRYLIQVSALNCFAKDSITILDDSLPISTVDTLCLLPSNNIKLEFDIEDDGYEYTWTPTTEKTKTISVSNPGRFTLNILSRSGCSTYKTFEIINAPQVDVGVDKIFCDGESIEVNPMIEGTGSMTFEWSSGQSSKNILLNRPGLYYLKVIQKGCSVTDSIRLTTKNCVRIIAPNTFTPNNDGINDVFEVNVTNGIILKFEILNRTNNIIHASSFPTWDGKINNLPATQEMYFYKLLISSNDGISNYSNAFLLLR